MNRNYSLDFFRGLMALFVAIGHYFYWNNSNTIPLSFILAVDYFFILSGYVLTGSVLNKNNFNSFTFAKSRWLRLFPVYIVCVITSLILYYSIGIQHVKPRIGDIIKIISIGQMLPFNTGSEFLYVEPMGIAWSISAEFWIGIIFFPIICYLYKNKNELCFVFLTLSVLIPFFIINNYSPEYLGVHYQKYSNLIFFGLLRGYMGYSLGALIFFITKNNNNNYKSSLLSLFQIVFLLLIILIYARNNYNRNDEYFSVFLFAIMIISLSFGKGIVYTLTNNWFGKWLGKISYPLYLLHPLFIEINHQIFNDCFNILPLLIYFIFIITFSVLIHIYIENKFLIYFKS